MTGQTARDNQLRRAQEDFEAYQSTIQHLDLTSDYARATVIREIVTGLVRGRQQAPSTTTQLELIDASVNVVQAHLENAFWSHDIRQLPRVQESSPDHGVYCHVLEELAGDEEHSQLKYVYVGETTGRNGFSHRIKQHRKSLKHSNDCLHYHAWPSQFG